MRRPQRRDDLVDDRLRPFGGDDPLFDEPRCVPLAGGRLRLDPLDLQWLGVRGLVLLLVSEAAVADEVDDEVVAELGAVREREPDCAQSAASGSSAFTWTIGTSKPFARSLE